MILIHYPCDLSLPSTCQPDWQTIAMLDLPSLPRRRVARAPAGTPIPDGAEPYSPPEATDEHRRLARADLERIASAPDSLRAGLARIGLDERERLDEYILACLGVVHPLALVAPFSIATMSEAVRTHLRASNAWTSPHSSVVVRCALRGYNVWTGIGVMMARAGRADDYASAEALGVAAVRDRRRETLRWVREEVLAGWSPETPYYTSTIARAEAELPITVRRGPTTNQDLGIPSSSYDLPIVAVFRGDSIERFPERVTWSDDASRARERQRRAEGHRRAQEEQARALDLLRQSPVVGPYVGPKSLPKGLRFLVGRENVAVTVGPVRLRQDGTVGLALVELHGGHRRPLRTWMALGQLAVRSLDPGPGQGRVDF